MEKSDVEEWVNGRDLTVATGISASVRSELKPDEASTTPFTSVCLRIFQTKSVRFATYMYIKEELLCYAKRLGALSWLLFLQ